MKLIKAKPNKTSQTIDSLIKRTPPQGAPAVERVLVVYGEGEQPASIYSEPSQAPKATARP